MYDNKVLQSKSSHNDLAKRTTQNLPRSYSNEGKGKESDQMESKMDAQYWKEFENMGESSGSEGEIKSPYDGKDVKKSKKDVSKRKKRSRSSGHSRSRSRSHSRSHSGSRSHSSSSSSSCSSSRSSSSSSRHRSNDRKYPGRNRFNKTSPSGGRNQRKGNNYNRDGREDGTWFPPHQYPNQGPDIPPSTFIPQQFPQAPLNVPGQYPPNFQGPFGGNYHPPFPGYDSGTPNYFPPNFPPHTGSQPPHHEYPMGGPPGGLGPPAPSHPPSNWEMFPDTTHPPPMMQGPGETMGAPPMAAPDVKSEEAKKEAIEQELLQQKRTLSKQREDYVRRKFSLNRELNRLKDQKRDLMKEKSKENERILRENAKLQGEIQQKLKSIDNVIEMLTNIIGDGSRLPDVIKEIKNMEKEKSSDKTKKPVDKKKHSPVGGDSRRRSISTEKDDAGEDFHDSNRVYYDPGLHWCSECNVFPKTVNEYLNHLHSAEHKDKSKMKLEDFPWHAGQNLKEKSPQFSKDNPPKRTPIRGVQFLVPATAWFCSMCKTWLGDSHCASKHVQSYNHTHNYNEFIKKHPHWEVDWLTERTKSYEKNSEAKQSQQKSNPVPSPSNSTSMTIASLSDQLLAMLAANSKGQDPPPPPPPPPITKSSSSSGDDDSPERRSKKKKKKSKKKHTRETKSPSKEKIILPSDQIKLNFKSMPERKVDPVPVDDSFISEWMPRVEKREPVPLKKKLREESDGKTSSKRMRSSAEGREASYDRDLMYNDHDDAVIFDKQSTSRDPRSKKRNDDDLKYFKHPKHERESPKDRRPKYEDKYKSKYEKEDRDDSKLKKYQKDFLERERNKKSPFSKMKDNAEKKKKAKPEKNSDEDVHETSFEKRTSESAAKKKEGKKLTLTTLPKTKLPFIGRMPILKKKVEQKPEEKEEKKEGVEEDGNSKETQPAVLPSEAPVGDIVAANISDATNVVDELPKSTLIISKRPRLAEPGIVKKEILFNKPANDNLTEQDMDLDDDTGVPKEEETPKDELHKDFKDALDLLFPEEKKKEEGETTEIIPEPEGKVEELVQSTAVPPPGYVMPPGYEVMQAYYGQQAYVQQQWAQMGYDQQYPGAYSYPPPREQPPPIELTQPPPETSPVEPKKKKKKNAPSQRVRRHLQKKRAKAAAEAAAKMSGEEKLSGGEGDDDEGLDDEGQDNGEVMDEPLPKAEHLNPPGADMSDLAMLGIDEDDAAAQGFY